jgi:cytochrome c peroxidase
MHDGSLATLEHVIDYYDRGGNENPTLDPEVRRLNLSAAEKRDLLEFLRCLDGVQEDAVPDTASRIARPASLTNNMIAG